MVNKQVTKGQSVKIVVETKSMELSREEWRKELDTAMLNRGADIAVAVVQKVEQMPNKSRINIGIDAGVQLGSYFRVEADVDRAWRTDGKDGYRVTLNGIGQYRIPNSVVTPYVIAGGGYALDGTAIWNVGAGTRIALSQAVELDLRYREVRPFEDRKAALKQDHVFTTGLNYRF